ncbi:MAG: hypothetical protein ACTH5M_10725 [Psychrobacter sp.]|uniref:hypothetical protein n=1 Tax=Psychrobacter sp. AOP7-B1-24 TaxID=3457645 RepID=UPI003FB95A84
MKAIKYLKKASKDQAIGTILITCVIMSMFVIAGPAMEKMAGRANIGGFEFIWQLISSSVPAMLFILLVISNIVVDLLVLRNINYAKYNLWLFIPNICIILIIIFWDKNNSFENLLLFVLFAYKSYRYYKYYSHYRQYMNQKEMKIE